MSGQLRALKNRIKSVESTQKITKAMEMIATAKLKRYQTLREQSAPYENALQEILARLLKTNRSFHHPLLEKREEKQIAVLLSTSDTGLCGSFNQDLIETAKTFLKNQPRQPLLIGFGKNGINGLARAGYAWHTTFKDTKTSQLETVFREICQLVQTLFREQTIDALYIIHSRFVSKTTCRARIDQFLPFSVTSAPVPSAEEEINALLSERRPSDIISGTAYIMEPDPAGLFERLIPLVFESKMRMSFIETLIAEQTARMNAMQQATDNASELIDTLVLLRNKVRQAAITNELIEIVSGSQALKS